MNLREKILMILRTAFKIYPTYKEMTFRLEAKLAKVKIYAEDSEKYIYFRGGIIDNLEC